MKRRHLIFFLLVLVTISSCNLPAPTPTAVETSLPLSQPTTEIPVTGINTSTPVPVETLVDAILFPTTTSSPTPSTVLASPRAQPVNCRFGPDVAYAAVGALIVGRQAEVIGKNIDITWIYVRNPSDPSTSCWLFADLVNVDGNLETLPVVGPPEIMVTDINVRIDPPTMNVACDAFPQSVIISADITTNGPLVVTWYWESSTGQVSNQKQILFEAGETKTVQDYYQVPQAGDYYIRVRNTPPNSQVGEATFKAICTP
jgi:uncharacterized protein YraI